MTPRPLPAEPIRIRCEGSDCPAHGIPTSRVGICSMCGAVIHTTPGGLAFSHERDDILAMIDRGDFG